MGERNRQFSVLRDPHSRGRGEHHQFTSASEAIVLLLNEEPLPLLLCAVGLYGPFEAGLLLPGEGGVWGLSG